MRIGDLSKDVQRLLLAHWTGPEIESRLSDPEYFFEHVVVPRLEYLQRSGAEVPRIRFYRTPNGAFRVILMD